MGPVGVALILLAVVAGCMPLPVSFMEGYSVMIAVVLGGMIGTGLALLIVAFADA